MKLKNSMKKILVVGAVLLSLLACNTKKVGSMEVQIQVDGLKKGTVYLQKVVDTLMVTVDSIVVDGAATFTLSDNVESPEMYYITLADSDKKILFFGEKGKIEIKSKLDRFDIAATIKGSKNQDLLNQYNKMISKFNNQQLDLIQADFEANKTKNEVLIDSIDKLSQRLLIRRYLYATNFAVTHPKNEVSAYIALTDLYNANIKLLDTINNSLIKSVKQSKYGLQLNRFIAEIKKNEK